MKRNIFCLESEWNSKLTDKTSIESLLTYLKHSHQIDHTHRRVSNKETLINHLKESKKAIYKKYEIIYLASHGESRGIELSDGNTVDIMEIAKECNGHFQDKIVHFGSCRTLLTSERVLDEFKKETGAKLVSGYTKTIDFLDGSLLDIAYFNHLQEVTHVGNIKRRMESHYSQLCERMGFKLY